MEVVYLILGPMLASQPCSYAFWVLTSLHLSPYVFIILYTILCRLLGGLMIIEGQTFV